MKKYSSFLKFLFVIFASFFITGCVHDDKYNDPNLEGYQCQDLTATLTIAQVKALHGSTAYVFPANSTAVMEGYVSSSDETGNIYKTIYIQDSPTNPTQGFTISVDAVSTYTKFPQGSKIYIKLNDLALGTYGGLVQLGIRDADAISTGADAVSRIPESAIPAHVFRSCTIREKIVPKVLTYAQLASNQNLLGALVQLDNVEFDSRVLCTTFAPDGTSVDKKLNQQGSTLNVVVRNSGFASFANQILPAGKGTFIGIFSKFSSTYQFYINRVTDIEMNSFPRTDGIATNPCALDLTTVTPKTIAEVKQLFTGALTQITGDFVVKAKVTANDETGNLFKYVYIEDATGGIRVNINKTNLYQDARFRVGKEIYIKLKNLYIGNVSGELQLGQPFNGNVGQIAETDVYKTFFDSNLPISAVVPTEKTITQLTTADVGKWIKIKNLEFINTDLGSNYASGSPTNRTLKDCSGNTILLRTSNFASFASTEIDGGRGDVYAILSIFNGTYQLWIPKQIHADLDNPRCDGTVPPTKLFMEDFQNGLGTFTQQSIAGTQAWATSNQGTGSNYYAVMNGASTANEDWLISKEISLSGFTSYSLAFDSDGRATTPGNPLQVLITDSYTGNPTTTTWTTLNAPLDTVLGAFGFVNSGLVSLNAFANKNVRVAFKYTNTTTASTTWELDNVKILGQ
ncbi:DUF5689 domain-containing protein [Chryseobacterium sp.]|uniref:DUF5689 domain-containing protein n=1 Tax=Chryseobacterium sp. TaxID=1871047 RepID=UPI0011CBE7E6|nr:DUF5689 domain-containing protein [Chryseobacterium sp.]TXF76188.1 hypothetical protein FUA25_09880 [Chryseobacterium sp.]